MTSIQSPVFDGHANLWSATVATAPSPATSGTSLVVQSGLGASAPAVPFNATLWPSASSPTAANAEIVRVTAVSTDTLTIVRAQEGTSAQSVTTSFSIAAAITKKTLVDTERYGRPDSIMQFLSPVPASMQTVEYGNVTSGNIQTIFSADSGVSGVIKKLKIIGGGNGMLNNWIQISYDGGNTWPFVAEVGTLFCAYPGASAVAGQGPWEASCAHMATQQAATNGTNFYAVHMLKYPIPFTNGCLIQIFDPSPYGFSVAPYAEVTCEYMPAADVPPVQLQCTGTNLGFNMSVAISALTNVSTVCTATVATTSGIYAGQSVTTSGVAGFTTNNPNGTYTVTAVLGPTQFTFTAGAAPTGSYTANSGSCYSTASAASSGSWLLNTANLSMYTTGPSATNAVVTASGVAQLAHMTGFAGWAVGLAYTASCSSGLSCLERNFGWYVDGATAPTSSGTTTTPTQATHPITGCTNTGTTVTYTMASNTGIGVGQNVIVSGVKGIANVNGSWTVASLVSTTGFTAVVTTVPTGTYTASTGTAWTSGSPYGTQVGSPSMQTTGTEDTFDSAYYAWAQTYPAGVSPSGVPAVGGTGVAVTNPFGVPMDVYLKNTGTATVTVAVNGTTVSVMGIGSATNTYANVCVPPNGTITLTYTGTPAPTWTWVVSAYQAGGPLTTYSQPTSMGIGNGTASHNNYYNAFLDILESCGGYRFTASLDLWLLTESHVSVGHTMSWTLLYYKDLS